MKASGLSLYRYMAPLLIISFMVSVVSIYFNGWVVPYTNKQKYALARTYLHKYLTYISKSNIYIQDSETRIISIGDFDDVHNIASNVTVEDFNNTDLTIVQARYQAKQMVWDKEYLESFTILNIGRLNFIPADIAKKKQRPDEMDYYDLKTFIEHQKSAGYDVARWEVDFYSKISFPFASFIVVLFGVPFSSIKRRSGVGVEFGIAVGVSFLYMIFLKISQAFGYNGDLNPLFTAWLANIIFLGAGIWNLYRVPK
jgi:lipopolysaccharide export system permease protein